MKKTTIALMGLALLSGGTLMAAEQGMEGMNHGDKAMHMKMSDEYCTKHCNAMEISKQVKDLEKAVEADKAALNKSGGSDKILTLEAKKNEVKKHLNQHIKELNDLKVELEKVEKELADLGKK